MTVLLSLLTVQLLRRGVYMFRAEHGAALAAAHAAGNGGLGERLLPITEESVEGDFDAEAPQTLAVERKRVKAALADLGGDLDRSRSELLGVVDDQQLPDALLPPPTRSGSMAADGVVLVEDGAGSSSGSSGGGSDAGRDASAGARDQDPPSRDAGYAVQRTASFRRLGLEDSLYSDVFPKLVVVAAGAATATENGAAAAAVVTNPSFAAGETPRSAAGLQVRPADGRRVVLPVVPLGVLIVLSLVVAASDEAKELVACGTW
jgi:hypothetical protein